MPRSLPMKQARLWRVPAKNIFRSSWLSHRWSVINDSISCLIQQVYILTESFKQLDAVYYFDTDSDYFDILETCWQESKEEVRV